MRWPMPWRPIRTRSLSARLLWLTVGVVLVVEVLVFLPQLAQARLTWLHGRMEDAHIAGLAAIAGSPPDATMREELLRLSGTLWIRLQEPRRPPVELAGSAPALPVARIDLDQESALLHVLRALSVLTFDRHQHIALVGVSPMGTDAVVELVYARHDETRALRRFARRTFWLSLLIAGTIGALVHAALRRLLVRPMRRLTDGIATFRADPEHATPLDPAQVTPLVDDEIARASRELAAMQRELRAALWRNARLAALGVAAAKVSHDLRGLLTPALLTADRLTAHADPTARHAGEIISRSVDRAIEMIHRGLDFTRDEPPSLHLTPVALAQLVDEASEPARAHSPGFRVVNRVPPTLTVPADRTQLFRVLANLMRNAAEAGARSVQATGSPGETTVVLDLADDGPGLPALVQAALFRPFVTSRSGGSGLGLAIAHELMRAHGGDIALLETGPGGTIFRLTLPARLWLPHPPECTPDTATLRPPA